MTEELMDIVNENDEVVGQATRSNCYANRHHHRIVHVLVFDDAGRMALQKSSDQKTFMPGHWGTTAGGHVQAGESYEEAAQRELKEEIGISTPITLVGKSRYRDPSGLSKFISLFSTNYEGSFVLDPIEAGEVKYFSIDELKKLIASSPNIYPELRYLLDEYYF